MDQIPYLDINRKSWNNRVETHVQSAFYNVDGFKRGASSLNEIELALLGDVTDKNILHLQCHFGQDSLSLARLGACVTGVDLSDKAIDEAIDLAREIQVSAEFICCDIYELPKNLHQTYDIVFTSYGTIGWLPDIHQWASVIAHFLKPGGKFVFVEFHPAVWMFDDNFHEISYNYFNTGPIVEQEDGTYADRNAPLQQSYVMWNHSIGEVLSGLLANQLRLTAFQEFDYSPYNCFKHTVKVAKDKYRIAHLDNKLPMVYALTAEKAT
ncbi:class I SAM-dependent methyltransferase [Sphingobacterium suaedae]|uniref:Class I SAM-dependent methyltransferase n=1 Tax=Sphingobacterium suaedae TaxID=1686402 RepID=A0ABW5KBF3_9SPHI